MSSSGAKFMNKAKRDRELRRHAIGCGKSSSQMRKSSTWFRHGSSHYTAPSSYGTGTLPAALWRMWKSG
ncbi:hypothetical protein BGZ61DRAFT_468591 [Ilyonectria robusta]|uniref:uncharacterized protein n=1 Tax=Ilyonectria robusta TaxID=1079257 RepID=UPI001E8D317E|nr:uncharacterized protein BGZ61DRAFT_468591 [Ilyonectria robusta]KAH8652822.1 hypothetical protein BGZ61DRAFT_468591 [Ilyonectria robusta]